MVFNEWRLGIPLCLGSTRANNKATDPYLVVVLKQSSGAVSDDGTSLPVQVVSNG